MRFRLSSFARLALGPRLCDPVITTELAVKGSVIITLLCMVTILPLISLFQYENSSLIFLGITMLKSESQFVAPMKKYQRIFLPSRVLINNSMNKQIWLFLLHIQYIVQ